MSLIERIDAYEAEGEALDTLLSPICDRFIEADGIRHTGFYLDAFDTDTKGNIKLTAVDSYDGETRSYWIPAAVVESGDLDAWFAQRAKEIAEKKAIAEEASIRQELARLGEVSKALRAKLKGH